MKLCGVASPEQGYHKRGQSSEIHPLRRFSRKPESSKKLVHMDPRPQAPLKQRTLITLMKTMSNYKTSLTRNGTKVSVLLIYGIHWLILAFFRICAPLILGAQGGKRVAQNRGVVSQILVLYVAFGTCLE